MQSSEDEVIPKMTGFKQDCSVLGPVFGGTAQLQILCVLLMLTECKEQEFGHDFQILLGVEAMAL